MIGKHEILENAKKFGLAANIIEKDYVLGWILAGISINSELQNSYVFKGGTCLKKCFFKDYRFSEDLDFTVRDSKHMNTLFLKKTFLNISDWIYENCGIEILNSDIRFDEFQTLKRGIAIEGRLAFQGPLQRKGDWARIKLDLTHHEKLVFEPINLPIYHPYSDKLKSSIQSYCLEEIFAEKLRALVERLRPRDLYDVISLFERKKAQTNQKKLLACLQEKCEFKKVSPPEINQLHSRPEIQELTQEWSNMLAYQIKDLPPYETYWEKLPTVLNWIYDL
jgi:predicted nucleotidyltransferase component of viral defense system